MTMIIIKKKKRKNEGYYNRLYNNNFKKISTKKWSVLKYPPYYLIVYINEFLNLRFPKNNFLINKKLVFKSKCFHNFIVYLNKQLKR